jgi:hypothetical protein
LRFAVSGIQRRAVAVATFANAFAAVFRALSASFASSGAECDLPKRAAFALPFHSPFNRKEERNMPRKKSNAEANEYRPLLHFERIVYEKATFKLSKGVIANIDHYIAYLKSLTADEATADEIVDRGLQRLFDADRGFRQWLNQHAPAEDKPIRREPVNEIARYAMASNAQD